MDKIEQSRKFYQSLEDIRMGFAKFDKSSMSDAAKRKLAENLLPQMQPMPQILFWHETDGSEAQFYNYLIDCPWVRENYVSVVAQKDFAAETDENGNYEARDKDGLVFDKEFIFGCIGEEFTGKLDVGEHKNLYFQASGVSRSGAPCKGIKCVSIPFREGSRVYTAVLLIRKDLVSQYPADVTISSCAGEKPGKGRHKGAIIVEESFWGFMIRKFAM